MLITSKNKPQSQLEKNLTVWMSLKASLGESLFILPTCGIIFQYSYYN